MTYSSPDSEGVPDGVIENTLVADYNDLESVRRIFSEYGAEIAAVIVEPVAANMGVVPPNEGFLEGLREITKRYGSILIFDEVITGFRLSPGGASEWFGVVPDMVTLGKVIGGGMPLAAYGGRKDIMDVVSPLGKVYQAGTLSGNPVATAAGIAAIKKILGDRDIYKRLEERAVRLEEVFSHMNAVCVNRVGSLMSVFFTEETKVENYRDVMRSDTARFAQFFNYMLGCGVYVAPSQFEAIFLSDAHSDEDLSKTIEKVMSFKELYNNRVGL